MPVLDVPAEALELHESAGGALSEGAIQDDGTTLIHVIRPGMGNSSHRHYYSPEMLEANAEVFTGWPMYVDHLAPAAKKALAGLPRSMRDIGGKILESWWDPSVPADARHEQGAVVARVKPLGYMKDLIEAAPELVKTSISAGATGVKPIEKGGNRMFAVEGIAPIPGSVDFVTEAGAGGRVVSFINEAAANDGYQTDLLEDLTDDEIVVWVQQYRPELAEALSLGEGDATGNLEGGTMPEGITPEALRESLATDEGREIVASLVREAVESDDTIRSIVESAVAEERDLIMVEAEARADRKIALRDLRDAAHNQINEAKLPGAFAEQSKARFDLIEGVATPGLNVVDDLDDQFQVTKSAAEKLTEAVEAEIASQRALLSEARPTRVVGQGRTEAAPATKEDGTPADRPVPAEAAELLREAGFSDNQIQTEVYA